MENKRNGVEEVTFWGCRMLVTQ